MSGGKPVKDPAATEREMLPAEKTFDRAVYGGISYAAQAATGIVLTYWLKYGSGKPHFEKAAKWLGPKVFRNRTVEEATKEISSPLMVSTMIMVGNTFLLPVKWLENNKAKIVRSWHEKHDAKMEAKGTPFTAEEKAHNEECLQKLEKEPPQTWGSLLGGRAFGLAAVYATLFALGNKRNEAAEEFSAKVIMKGVDAVGMKSLAKSKTFEKYIHVGFLDVFYSMVSAGGLYVYSHVINPPKHAPIDVGAPIPKDPSIFIGPTPATPAIDALQPEEAPAKQFTETIRPKEIKKEVAKVTPKGDFRQKLTAEEMAPLQPGIV